MRTRPLGARAFITTALTGAILFSVAAASPMIAAEPTDPSTSVEAPVLTPAPTATEPTTDVAADPAPTTDPTPAPDATPAADVASAAVPAPAVVRPKTTEARQIIAIARRQIGDPWRHGARGPRSFDCSGLVIYAFKKAGDAKAVGRGHLASARALYRWYKARGLASRHDPKIGDLVIWGGGTHVGIYIGKGKAISTLTSGVRIHRVHAVTARFTAYLHTGMWKKLSS